MPGSLPNVVLLGQLLKAMVLSFGGRSEDVGAESTVQVAPPSETCAVGPTTKV